MAKSYSVINGAAVTTAAFVAVTTSAAVKTMIELTTSASSEARIIEWWWEGSAASAATPAVVEHIFCSLTTPPTVTAYAAADIKKYEPNSRASLMTLGTTASGYSASAEGTVTTPAGQVTHQIGPTTGMYVQYPLGRELEMPVSSNLRLRNTISPAVNAVCGYAWEE